MKDYEDYETQRDILLDYLQVMIARSDWHGVSDAANDHVFLWQDLVIVCAWQDSTILCVSDTANDPVGVCRSFQCALLA